MTHAQIIAIVYLIVVFVGGWFSCRLVLKNAPDAGWVFPFAPIIFGFCSVVGLAIGTVLSIAILGGTL